MAIAIHEYFMQTCQEYLASLGFDLQHLIQAEGFDKNACLDKDNKVSAVNAVCTNDESLARFTVMARDVFKKKQSLITEPALTSPFKFQHDAIEAIYDHIHQKQELATDLNAVLRSMHGVISEFVTVENQTHSPNPEPGKLYDLSQINFDRLKTEFEQSPTKKTQVQTLKEAVDQQLRRMLNQNSTRIDLCIRYQEIVANYNQETDRATIEQTFEQLLNLIESLSKEDSRAVREGLTEDNLTIFDLLCKQKENLSVQVRNRIKQVAQNLLESIQTELQRLENWRDKETTKAQVETSIYNYLYDEATGLPTESYDDQEIAELSKVIFLHLYRQSPATNYPIYPNVA